MKTHVRVHGDQLQGAQEENFIVPLNDDCCGMPIANGANCNNPNCRNTRTITNLVSNKRRRSTDPMSNILSNFGLPNSTNNSSISKDLLLASSLNPILSNSLVNGLMGNLVNNLTNHLNNHLVSGLVGSNLTNPNLSGGLSSVNELLGSAATNSVSSEAEDNLDNLDIQPNSTTSSLTCTTIPCNGTTSVVSVSSNSSNNIGKC